MALYLQKIWTVSPLTCVGI